LLPRLLDIQNQRVASVLKVYKVMFPVPCAASIEAGQAHIQTGWIVD